MKKETIYLVAYYSMRPKNQARTQIKGWMKDPGNIQYDEQVAVTTKLRRPDREYAKIILDMGNKTVVRNGWNSSNTFDELFGYFAQGYPKYTFEVMNQLDPEYLTRFMTQIATAEEAQEIVAGFNEQQQIKSDFINSIITDNTVTDAVIVDTSDVKN
jgi:hypothetical protein